MWGVFAGLAVMSKTSLEVHLEGKVLGRPSSVRAHKSGTFRLRSTPSAVAISYASITSLARKLQGYGRRACGILLFLSIRPTFSVHVSVLVVVPEVETVIALGRQNRRPSIEKARSKCVSDQGRPLQEQRER